MRPLPPEQIKRIKAIKAAKRAAKPGLGDRVAAALAAFGITKERVSKAFGKPCGCPKRQQRLNELGRKLGIG